MTAHETADEPQTAADATNMVETTTNEDLQVLITSLASADSLACVIIDRNQKEKRINIDCKTKGTERLCSTKLQILVTR